MVRFLGRAAACSAAVLALLATSSLVTPTAQALSPGVAFSADSLPSWQTDGVAYAVGAAQGKVFVGGTFTQLVPPAGQAGDPVAAPGLAVLDADTGAPTSCRLPVVMSGGTAEVRALTASPDGSTVYVGGNFTSVGGVVATRFAAIDVAACTVRPIAFPALSSFVYGIAATNDTVYLAGAFNQVGGQTRNHFAALSASTGAVLPWTANTDRPGRALVVSPDRSKVAIGGDFFSVNGSYSHSIAVVDATSGANVRTYPAGFIDDYSVTKTIVSDGSSFYVGNEGTGSYVFDGRIALDWKTLDQRWRDTCYGATQALLAYGGILYSASHTHECTSIGYFQNGTRKFFNAETTADHTFRGWNPTANDGVGEGIGGRGLALAKGGSGSMYLYAVGEFTKINGATQMGITRFGTKDTGAPPTPVIQAEALASKTVQVRVWTVVDPDDQTLTYRVYRDGSSSPVWTGQATSWWWSRPQITFTDKTAKVGTTHSYRVTASDGTNVSALSGSASAKPVNKSLDYPAQVVADGASLYWRFDEPSGTWVWNKGKDTSTGLNGLTNGGVTLGVGWTKAAAFDGVNDFVWNDQFRLAPKTYTVETWIKTSTKAGGKIIGYSDNRPRTDTGAPLWATTFDRHVYMDNSGRLNFGVYPGKTVVLTSPKAYNDSTWHHIVASQGSDGMSLRVDGLTVARNKTTGAQAYLGVWKVGGDTMGRWPNRGTSEYFAGQIDDTAVYEGKVLSDAATQKHFTLSGRKVVGNSAPKDAYGAAVYAAAPQLYWPLNESKGDMHDRSIDAKRPGTVGSGITRRSSGVVGDKRGIGTSGKSGSAVATKTKASGPGAFTVETWIKTTSTKGGKVIGFENYQKATSTQFDKQLYLTNDGSVVFGVRPAGIVTLKSGKGLNDGRWHHLVGTQGANGSALYVDGKSVASNPTTTSQKITGYWRLGGGNLAGWPSRPSSNYFAGSIDDTSVYTRSLTAGEVAAHYSKR